MKRFILSILFILSFYSLSGCTKPDNTNEDIDRNSYIRNFELFQENPNNENSIIIKSPKAIIYPINNDIEIFNSTIDILSNDGQDVQVKSGKSKINNTKNQIKVMDNVFISLIDSNDYFIETSSFNWNLNTSNIDLNSPLDINFNNTKILSSNGTYDINSKLLRINNNVFNRSIYNNDRVEQYNINIISDRATWLKKNNSLEFMSDNKQVETTINILTIK